MHNYEEAYQLFIKIKEKIIKVFEKDRWELATFYQNCANLFFQRNQDYLKALEYDNMALDIRKNILELHIDTAQSYFSVAYDLYMLDKQKNIEKCNEYAKKSYNIYLELLGLENANTINAKKLLDAVEL